MWSTAPSSKPLHILANPGGGGGGELLSRAELDWSFWNDSDAVLYRNLIQLNAPWAHTGLHVVRVTHKQKELNWVVLNCRVPGNFFSSRGSLRPFKGSPRSRASRGPLTHTFIRRKRSFSEVKYLHTSLLIICQKEKIPVIFRKNRQALRTCGRAVRQRFIPYWYHLAGKWQARLLPTRKKKKKTRGSKKTTLGCLWYVLHKERKHWIGWY